VRALKRPLLVVDGDSFAHRAYHALPKSIRRVGNHGGRRDRRLRELSVAALRERAASCGAGALGHARRPDLSQKLFPGYQGGRQFDDELVDQLEMLPELVAACGFANAKAPGYEADDFLAAAVAEEKRRGRHALVASGDRDAFQLASDTVTILHPVRAGEIARIGPAEVRERYGVEPEQVPDFIALRGDPSDKLPGARGVGAKGAAALLRTYATLEDALTDSRFPLQADELRLYRRIAAMDPTAPLPSLNDQTPTWGEAAALARKWELNRLADRFEELAPVGA
jgi:DNA polymerase-1